MSGITGDFTAAVPRPAPTTVTTTEPHAPIKTTVPVPSTVPDSPPTEGITTAQRELLQKSGLETSVDYDTKLHQVIVTFTRTDTGQVVQQLPSEQVIKFLEGILAKLGLVLDAKG